LDQARFAYNEAVAGFPREDLNIALAKVDSTMDCAMRRLTMPSSFPADNFAKFGQRAGAFCVVCQIPLR
jgi:hypothetical protein